MQILVPQCKKGQDGVRERFCTMGIEQVAQGSGHRAAGVQEAFGRHSQTEV